MYASDNLPRNSTDDFSLRFIEGLELDRRIFPEDFPLPLYEYRCTACGYSFEKIQSFSATPESVCPKCQGVLIRPVTAPALRFEGAGWYVNDYAGKGAAKTAEASKAGGESAAGKAEPKSETKTASSDSSATPAATAPTSAPSASSGSASSSGTGASS